MIALGPILKGEAKDAMVFGGSNLLNLLGAVVLLPLYLTKLSPSDFGVLAVITVIGAFQALPSSLSLDLAITRLYYVWPEATRRRNLGAIWMWNWVATLATGAAFLVASPLVGPILFPDVPVNPFLILGIFSNTLANLFVIPASTIRIQRLPKVFATFNVLSFVASSTLGILFVFALNLGLQGYIVSMILSNLVVAVAAGIVMLQLSDPARSSPGLREALVFSLPAIPSQLIGTTASVLDRLFLSSFASLETLGIYSVAMRFVAVISALHGSLKMTFGPFIMKNLSADRNRGGRLVEALIPYYLIPYFAAGLGLCLFIGPLVRIVDEPAYFEVVDVVPWLVGIAIISSLYVYYCNGLLLANRTDLLSIPAAVQLVVLAVTSAFLIVPFQLGGIIVSRYLGAIVFFGLSLYLSQRVFPLHHHWIPLMGLATVTLVFVLLGGSVTVESIWLEIGIKTVLWGLFVVVAWLLVSRARLAPNAISVPGS